jgi:hypothetical protein
MERKKLSFTSPPKAEGTDELHLIIKRTEYVKNTSMCEENQLYDDYLPYVAHGKDKFTKIIANILVHGFSFRSMYAHLFASCSYCP